MPYTPPLQEMQFMLYEVAEFAQLTELPDYQEATPDIVTAVLEEAGKLASERLAPLNQSGDREGCTLDAGGVSTASGFKQAYQQFVENGWNSLASDPNYGGQGLPILLDTAVAEMWQTANMAFALCPMLNQSGVKAFSHHASEALKQTFLEKMIAGEWTCTMNLTEPQAGSDLSVLRSKAEPEGDAYRISGQKIFITWGEHDMTDNIMHLLLARTPNAPAGLKGISLFLVPKFLVNADGSLGERNDLHCASLEHKLGIHASPTAVMVFGEQKGAIGYLVGEENRGLEYMFTMMNHARLAVGLQGLAIAERAYQRALQYAKERVQSREVGSPEPAAVAIIKHPDVRRMLMRMKAHIEAMRGLIYTTAAWMDWAQAAQHEQTRANHQSLVDLLTPIVKGWCTEQAIGIASIGIQIHGGMGYVEETGAAQYLRDAQITTIYEGTTGIQANDLIRRKIVGDQGAIAERLFGMMQQVAQQLNTLDGYTGINCPFRAALNTLRKATAWVISTYPNHPRAVLAGAVPYLQLFGTVAGGWQMAKMALIAHHKIQAGEDSTGFYAAKIVTAQFYAEHVLFQARSLLYTIENPDSVLNLPEQHF